MLVLTSLLGEPTTPTEEKFAVAATASSVTRDTIMKSGMWFGDPSYGAVTLIDTPGLGDSAGKLSFNLYQSGD
jgi:hypothetical protein